MKKYLHLLFLIVFAIPGTYANHLSSSIVFTARLSGDQEVPEVTTEGRGVAIISLDHSYSTMFINVSLNGNLSSPITGAHIHEGAAGQNGGVIFDLTPYLNGNRIKGNIRNIPRIALTNLLNGNYYINVHTEDHPSGEIRGQLGLETEHRYTALLNGSNEVPSVTTDALGLGIFSLTQSEKSVYFRVLFKGLSSPLTGAHIHNAPAGSNGGVVFNLQSFIQGNTIEGTWAPDATLLAALKAGELYINIHTENNPGGEIRGQILLMPGLTFDLTLNGSQEVPSLPVLGSGLGIVTISPELDQLDYYVLYDGLTAAATGAHFHAAAAGINGPVVLDLTPQLTSSTIVGSATLDVNALNLMMRSGFYINIHTAANPGGEIRGQIQKYAREAYTFDMNGGQEVPPVTTTATGAGVVTIDRDQVSAHYMIVYSGLEGNFTASHFHNAGPGVNGPVIFDLTGSFEKGGAFGYWDIDSDPVFTSSGRFIENEVYANVHSDLHPSGEIRGNIVRSSGLFTDLPFDPGFGDDLMLTAVLAGDDEVPPVATAANGIASVYFDGDRSKAVVNVTATGLTGPITGAHIHEGDFGTNGPVVFPLTNIGNRIQQEITGLTSLDLISLMNGANYINIHTAANPGGEIRGQLNLEQDYSFVATLTGDQEVPEVTTDARGLASIHYTLGTLSLEVNVQLTRLSSDITGAHFHSGIAGENGPVIIDLSDLIVGNTIRGKVDMTIDDLLALISGGVYINVHTTNNPGGEIRGQVNYLPGIVFDGWMSAMQEVPFATSEATGLAVATIYPGLNDIAVWMLADNVSGPVAAAHLHNAPLQTNGGVVQDLTAELNNNGLIHLGVVSDEMLGDLLRGEIYINAHTAAYPGGELRGQLFRLARDPYGFDLCPAQEVGVVTAPNAQGSGFGSIDRLHSNINLAVVADGLTGPLTQSHIHQAAIGVNGPVIADLTLFFQGTNSMSLFGATVDTTLVNLIRSGETYVNVHTAAHPAGEMRGQIIKENLCVLNVGIDPLASLVTEVSLSPVPVVDQLKVAVEMLEPESMQLTIIDLAGREISSHAFDFTIGINEVYLPAENLLPGFYALVISNGRMAQAFKFVK